MDIKLGYIEGISNIDTPYFSNISAQNDFFTNHQVTSISTTFYPPHYRNRIRFDVEDIDFTNQINYLWFEYNSKVYYYFIDDIDYINENTIELSIYMDVIQTYMFNIKFSNAIIERMFINRWNGNNYNRDYLRENVSDGLFTRQYTDYYKKDTWLVVVQPDYDSGGLFSQNLCVSAYVSNDNTKVMLPYMFYFIPVHCKYITYTKLTTGGASGTPVLVEHEIVDDVNIRNMLSDSKTLKSFVIQGNPFPDIFSVTTYNNSIELVVNSDYPSLEASTIDLTITKGSIKVNSMFCPFKDFHKIDNSHFDALEYISTNREIINTPDNVFASYLPSKNDSLGVAFSHFYVPALIDENYLRIEFGDGGGVTTYPLFNTNNLLKLNFACYLNNDEGCYTYAIENDTERLNNGLNYNTYCYSNIVASMTLLNDVWKEYQANNHGRWLSAGIGTVKSAIQFFAPIPAKAAYANNKISSLLSDPNRFDKRYKNPTIKSSYLAKINKARESNPINNPNTLGDLLSIGDGLLSQAVQDYNAYFSPDSIRQAGDSVSALITSQFIIRTRTLSVNDYEQCGHYYHRNGYKVDKYVNNLEYPFEYIQNRYYFNIIKVRDCDLHLRDYIENESDMENIKDRLKDGIRLWNVENVGVSIGDFTYDNVELDYLS